MKKLLLIGVFALTFTAFAKEKSITLPITSIRFELNKEAEIEQATLEVLCYKNRNVLNPMESHYTVCNDFKVNGTSTSKIILDKLDNEHYVLPQTVITYSSKAEAFACVKINVTAKDEVFAAAFDTYSLLSFCTVSKIPSFVGYDLSGFYGHRTRNLESFLSKMNETIPVILK